LSNTGGALIMRRMRSIHTALAAGDPGKDLFAYLFLLIMVFSFMLLMSFDQSQSFQNTPEKNTPEKNTPEKNILEKNLLGKNILEKNILDQNTLDHDTGGQKKSTESTYSTVAGKSIATLEKRGSKIFLLFGKDLYDPEKDLKKLEKDKRIVVKKDGEKLEKVLYIWKTDGENILLSHYLETFKYFSQHNISIAFAADIL
jgi:hypothetical protein